MLLPVLKNDWNFLSSCPIQAVSVFRDYKHRAFEINLGILLFFCIFTSFELDYPGLLNNEFQLG